MRVMHVRRDRSDLQNDLRVPCLSCTGLASDEDVLVLAFVAHAHPRALSDGKDVRRVLVPSLPAVLLHDRVRVERYILVRDDCNEE